MPAAKKGKVRRTQLITTYGVGSIVPAGDESFMVAGTHRWPCQQSDIHEPRLEKLLHVSGFLMPGASEPGHDVPVVRFPSTQWCPSCGRLDQHGFLSSPDGNKCNRCNVTLVPSRFVVACERGHIDDFPYFRWVHVGRPAQPGVGHRLSIRAGGVTASLRDIRITCSCGATRTMQDAFSRDALRETGLCSGRRPWLGDHEPCSHLPRTLQRGASNVYFASVRSSISIPPWSEGAQRLLNRWWAVLRAVPEAALEQTIQNMGLARGTDYTAADLAQAVKRRKEGAGPENAEPGEETLRAEEFEALCAGRSENSPDQDFVCVPIDISGSPLRDWMDQVSAVKRLREVRALDGFTRLRPLEPDEDRSRVAPLCPAHTDWLPAVEVIGEGVFLRIATARLVAWESQPDIVERMAHLAAHAQGGRGNGLTRVTPRIVLLHSLAHILIDEWSNASGYPAASLRERLYVDENRAGILIYTASSDAAGSLGGLVAQSEPDRLAVSLKEAIGRTSWCSSDPLCIEADATGVDSLNLAACHACLLLPEVSCETGNVLLDRALLVGIPDRPSIGFFRDLL